MYKVRPTPNSDSIKLCLRYTARDPRLRTISSTTTSFHVLSRSGEVTGGQGEEARKVQQQQLSNFLTGCAPNESQSIPWNE